jgi:hypothetical protein
MPDDTKRTPATEELSHLGADYEETLVEPGELEDGDEYGEEEYGESPQAVQAPSQQPQQRPQEPKKPELGEEAKKNEPVGPSSESIPDPTPSAGQPSRGANPANASSYENQNRIAPDVVDPSINRNLYVGTPTTPLDNNPNRAFKAPNPNDGANLATAARDSLSKGKDVADAAAKTANSATKAASVAEGAALDPGGELAKQAALKVLGNSAIGRLGATGAEAVADFAEIAGSFGVGSIPVIAKYVVRYWKILAALVLISYLPLIVFLIAIFSSSSFQGDPVPQSFAIAPLSAGALPTDFTPNFIMSDELALKSDTMTVQDIYDFLKKYKSPLIDKDYIENATQTNEGKDGAHVKGLYWPQCHPKSDTQYDCAAQIIYNATHSPSYSSKYTEHKTMAIRLNPQIILVRLETEQSLITARGEKCSDKCKSIGDRLATATGFEGNINDVSSNTDNAATFKGQVENAAAYVYYRITQGQAPTCHVLGHQSRACYDLTHKGKGEGVQPDGNYIIGNEGSDAQDYKIMTEHNIVNKVTKTKVIMMSTATAVFYDYTPFVYIGAYNLWFTMNKFFRSTADAQGIAQTLGKQTLIGSSSSGGNLADCAKVANNPLVSFQQPNDRDGMKSGTGYIIRTESKGDEYPEGQKVPIDAKICTLIRMYLDSDVGKAHKFEFNEIVGNHSWNVKNTSRFSNHWFGHSMDLNVTKYNVAPYIMPWIVANQAQLRAAKVFPSQVIGPVDDVVDHQSYIKYSVYGGIVTGKFYVDGHNNHVHIGYPDPEIAKHPAE